MQQNNLPPSPKDFIEVVKYFKNIFDTSNEDKDLTRKYPTLSKKYPELIQEVSKLKLEVRLQIAKFLNSVEESVLISIEIPKKYQDLDIYYEQLPKAQQPFSKSNRNASRDAVEFSMLIKKCLEIEGKCLFIEKPSESAKAFLNKWGINKAFSEDYPSYIKELQKKISHLSNDISSIEASCEKDYFKYLADKLIPYP